MDLDDYEDFELNDELIAATSFIEEQENDRSIETTNLPYLHCSGVDSIRSTFHRNSYVRNYSTALSIVEQCVDSLFDLNLSEDALANPQIIGLLFNKARMHIQVLDVSSRENTTFVGSKPYFELRLHITKFLTALHTLIQQDLIDVNVVQDGLRSLQVLLASIESTPIIKVLHNANSLTGNKCSSPVYHLLHGHLEWRWLRLMILLEIAKSPNDGTMILKDSDFEEQLQMFLCDLVTLSIAKYNRLNHLELLYSTPFLCTCVKEMWLMVQFAVERLHERDYLHSFWHYFNVVLESVRDGKNAYELYDKTKINRKVAKKILPDNWNEFTVWLLCGVAKLHGFSSQGDDIGAVNVRVKDNYDFMEKLVKNILCSDPSEESLRIILYITFPIFVEWWAPRSEIIITFWEYFHKKLNSPFFLQGAAPFVLAVISGSVVGYLKQIKDKIDAPTINPNETSYSIFIHLFGRLLTKFANSDESQIKKILGRITSKFSSLKMLALNETGIHNVVSMFLTLAVTSKLSETGQRIQNVLLQMPLCKLTANRQIALLRGHISLLILFTQKQLNISAYTTKILEQLTTIHLDESYGNALKMLADGMVEIFANTSLFQLGEYVLLDVWVDKHLSNVSGAEQERFLNCINDCLTKIPSVLFTVVSQQEHNLHKTLSAIYKHILPYVQRVFVQKDRSDHIGGCLAELAANLCLNARYCPSVAQKFDELFKSFAEGNSSNIQTLTSYMVLILSTEKVHTIEQSFIIRCWIKCNICSTASNVDLNHFTAIVVGLEEFRVVCDAEATDIVGAKDPLCMFFSEIGKSYQLTTDFRKKYLISEKVYSYLASLGSCISISLENLDNTMKIYSIIAIIILHCSQIVYIKGKNSCFFNVAMFQYILPNHLLTGRPQKPQHVQAVHKIWHLLLMGIEKLDFKNDQHLITILTNLIEKWLPHFYSGKYTAAKPLLSCMKECDTPMVNYVFEKVSSTFLQLQRRQPHQHATQVIATLSEILPNISAMSDILKTLLQTTGCVLMEHAMMVDDSAVSKTMIFDFFSAFVRCIGYQSSPNLKEMMCSHLTTLTSKHLAYYSALYFQFMQRFGKIDPVAVKSVIPHLKEVITNVEHLRGAGRDGKLRNELHKLEGALMAAVKDT